MDNALAKEVCKLHGKLTGKRSNWDSHWQEIADYVVPNKDDIWTRGNKTKGEKKTNKSMLFDATAIQANELLASALHSMLTNPTALWFELSTGYPELDKDDEVKAWLQAAVKRIHQVLNNSNFQTEIHEVYLDLTSFGTSSMRIEEDKDLILRFHSRPIFELYIEENSKGVVDTVSREYQLSGRQIIQEFGQTPFTPDELVKIEKDPMLEWDIIHLVRPKQDLMNLKKNSRFKFASVHVIKKLEKVVKESGFKEFPYIVPRWSKISGESYGRSPAMKSLPDIKMINEIMKSTIVAAQKIIDPPLQVPDDGVMMPLRTSPGSLNYYRAGTNDRIEPLQTGGRVDLGFQLMDQVKLQIRQAFFIDQLQLNEGPQMTATEVVQRTEEKLRLLGPILGRLHFELLKPMIDRIFGIMLRSGDLDLSNAPAELSDKEIEVRFSSAIARAQQTSEVDNLNRAMGTIGPIAEAKPEILDNFNVDEIANFVGDKFNLPQELFTKTKDIKQIREQRAEAENQARENEQNLNDAEVVQKAGPAMAQEVS